MALLFDLAKMTVSSAPGTGSTIALGVGVTVNGVTFLTFAQAGVTNGQVVDYSILDPGNGGCEVGTATYSSSGPSLTGRTPTISSNSNAAINASGSSQISISPRAETLQNASLFNAGTVNTAQLGSGTANSNAFLQGDSTWETQGRQLLATLTASGSPSTLSDTTHITSAFNDYEIVFENLIPSSASAVTGELQLYVGGTLETANYSAVLMQANTSSVGFGGSGSQAYINLSFGELVSTAIIGITGKVTIFGANSGSYKTVSGLVSYQLTSGGSARIIAVSGAYIGGTGAVTGMNFLFSSSTIASGSIKIVGLT